MFKSENNFLKRTYSPIHLFTYSPRKRPAFTLAEVLITLGIIGVVAAMTMPSVITNYQKKQTAAQLKKAYSIVSQALVTSQAENGDMSEWGFGNLGDTTGDEYEDFFQAYKIIAGDFVNKYFVPYLNVRDNCGIRCTKQSGVKRYRLNGSEWNWNDRFYYIVYMADGTIIAFMFDNFEGKLTTVYLYVDLNGDKKPNRAGRDIFTFEFSSDVTAKINLSGSGLSKSELLGATRKGCNKNAGDYSGDYCGALIQRDSWEITDDYPW